MRTIIKMNLNTDTTSSQHYQHNTSVTTADTYKINQPIRSRTLFNWWTTNGAVRHYVTVVFSLFSKIGFTYSQYSGNIITGRTRSQERLEKRSVFYFKIITVITCIVGDLQSTF